MVLGKAGAGGGKGKGCEREGGGGHLWNGANWMAYHCLTVGDDLQPLQPFNHGKGGISDDSDLQIQSCKLIVGKA